MLKKQYKETKEDGTELYMKFVAIGLIAMIVIIVGFYLFDFGLWYFGYNEGCYNLTYYNPMSMIKHCFP